MGRKSIQATFASINEKIEEKAAELVKQRFEEVASFAVYTAVPDESIDTGSYVTSFSIGPAGFGGGRSRKSDNKPQNQDPSAMKAIAIGQLQSDISKIDFAGLMTSGKTRVTLRNRAPHSGAVEDGTGWNRDGYHVFTTIRSRFS